MKLETEIGWPDGAQTRTSRLKRPPLCHSSSGSKTFSISDCRLDSRVRRINFMKRPIANRQLTIGDDLAVAEGFEPSIAGLTIWCLTNLATPQETFTEPLAVASGSNTQGPPRSRFPTNTGGDEGSRTLIVRFTRPTLCYPVELHRRIWWS